ncbi:MAG: 50S ribosomal protein L6 [Desulfobacterales bacterium]|nr:50S ribosomal protein L6 [Desulfobacterales bacterium]
MSRVGKKPIPIPEKTSVSLEGRSFTVKSEKGVLVRELNPSVEVKISDGAIHVINGAGNRTGRSLQGMTRSLIANMVAGVDHGFERILEINGIGYRAEVSGNQIIFQLGYSHPINFILPEGIAASMDRSNLKLSGIDKEKIGQTAAAIRRLRPPEPYKGKGIKYREEHIQRKAGKTGTK